MSDAADKLARTRLAIIAHVQQREHRSTGAPTGPASPASGIEEAWEEAPEPHEAPEGRLRDWIGSLQRAGSTWWRHHPAHAGLELARPVLASWARPRPLTYLAVAAAGGAALFLARPWRLISVTGVLLGLAKSSQLSAILASALSTADYSRNNEPPE